MLGCDLCCAKPFGVLVQLPGERGLQLWGLLASVPVTANFDCQPPRGGEKGRISWLLSICVGQLQSWHTAHTFKHHTGAQQKRAASRSDLENAGTPLDPRLIGSPRHLTHPHGHGGRVCRHPGHPRSIWCVCLGSRSAPDLRSALASEFLCCHQLIAAADTLTLPQA